MIDENNVMVDLETMGTAVDSAIVSIGAVKFSGGAITDRFHQAVNLQSCLDAGLKLDGATVMWWMKQSDEARQAIISGGLYLETALGEFTRWLGDDAVLWGNGSDFDNTILANAYKAAGMAQPWAFWSNRCYRTLKNLHRDIKMERTGTHHNALDDAESQARHLMKILAAYPQTGGGK